MRPQEHAIRRRALLGSSLFMWLVVWLLAGLLIPACKGTEETAEAWIMGAASAHQQADELLAADDLEGAEAILERAVQRPVPSAIAPEDARVMRQDLYFRLAEVALRSDAPERALAHTEAGLALGRVDDLFTANLHVAQGHSLEALGRDREAATAYFEALQINERLLRAQLGDEVTP